VVEAGIRAVVMEEEEGWCKKERGSFWGGGGRRRGVGLFFKRNRQSQILKWRGGESGERVREASMRGKGEIRCFRCRACIAFSGGRDAFWSAAAFWNKNPTGSKTIIAQVVHSGARRKLGE
jgi:hypothetical protein